MFKLPKISHFTHIFDKSLPPPPPHGSQGRIMLPISGFFFQIWPCLLYIWVSEEKRSGLTRHGWLAGVGRPRWARTVRWPFWCSWAVIWAEEKARAGDSTTTPLLGTAVPGKGRPIRPRRVVWAVVDQAKIETQQGSVEAFTNIEKPKHCFHHKSYVNNCLSLSWLTCISSLNHRLEKGVLSRSLWCNKCAVHGLAKQISNPKTPNGQWESFDVVGLNRRHTASSWKGLWYICMSPNCT